MSVVFFLLWQRRSAADSSLLCGQNSLPGCVGSFGLGFVYELCYYNYYFFFLHTSVLFCVLVCCSDCFFLLFCVLNFSDDVEKGQRHRRLSFCLWLGLTRLAVRVCKCKYTFLYLTSPSFLCVVVICRLSLFVDVSNCCSLVDVLLCDGFCRLDTVCFLHDYYFFGVLSCLCFFTFIFICHFFWFYFFSMLPPRFYCLPLCFPLPL